MSDLSSRVILQPRGGGEPIEIFDSDESEIATDTVLAVYTGRFGEPLDVTYTELPGLGAVEIGWVFAVPERMELPGPHEQFEMVLIPMVTNTNGGQPICLFVHLAQQRTEFQELFASGEIDELHHITLTQRGPDAPTAAEVKSQRRD